MIGIKSYDTTISCQLTSRSSRSSCSTNTDNNKGLFIFVWHSANVFICLQIIKCFLKVTAMNKY